MRRITNAEQLQQYINEQNGNSKQNNSDELQRQRLEIERQKIELQRQKLELERQKQNERNRQQQTRQHSTEKNWRFGVIISTIIFAIYVFFALAIVFSN